MNFYRLAILSILTYFELFAALSASSEAAMAFIFVTL